MYSKKERTHYLETLPRKRAGVNVVFVDAQNRVLVVKPSYRQRWLLPGGVVEKNESPLEGGIREVAEEIGLTLPTLQFLGVDYIRTPDGKDENFQFVFFGGCIDSRHICIDRKEILGFQFVKLADARKFLGANSKSLKRLQCCLPVLMEHKPVYMENGKIASTRA